MYMRILKKILLFAWVLGFTYSAFSQEFKVSLPAGNSKKYDGRLLLLLSNNGATEPRFQISDGDGTQLVFGVNVDDWQSGTRSVTNSAYGYPLESLSQVPDGEYYVQAVLHVYETFKRSDGHTVKLHMDQGEGHHWQSAPGNLYSTPVKMRLKKGAVLSVKLDKLIPPIKEPEDTKYIKHIKLQSKLLTAFWGRPMYLGAHVLLPEGWDTHPDVKYPLAIFHGHFPDDFSGFSSTPPDPNLKPDSSARFRIKGYNRIVQQEAYDFYKLWTGPDFPRVLAIEIQHATPYYDDSYAVNTANMGPYGDAITYELIPEIEKRFRGIGQGWARFMYGGSTGGWEVLAAQVFYPDEYNGCYAACPDPIDFSRYTVVDIYKDKNAYYSSTKSWNPQLQPGMRNGLGIATSTLKGTCQRELALGDNGRSGDQWDIWEATFSPTNEQGYPKRIWDRKTGVIDSSVAAYWKEHYDLTHIIRRDWHKIGNKLAGRIHIYVGEMDNYFLNLAVYTAEDMLKGLSNPACNCEVDYEPRAEHCWNGDHTIPNYLSRLRYHQRFIPIWTKEVESRAPAGADLKSWRY